MCPCGKKHSRSLCTAAIDDRRKGVIPTAELPGLTNPEDRESDIINSSTQNTVLSNTASQHGKNVLISTGSVFLRNNEGRELKCPVIFDSASNSNIISRKMETEFGWIASGRLQGTKTNFSCYLLKDNDSVEDTLNLFFELKSLGIEDDPCYRKDDQAMDNFKETVQYNNNRLNRVAISSDIRQAFLQICLADKHKDFVRPFLLAATIKYHIEKYNEIHPVTVQHLDYFIYVDDWIMEQDTREEALFISRHAKNIMKEAGMEVRKWISNDTALMAQWAAEGFDTCPMDASIRLGTNKTKVLGMVWQTLDDCLTLDTKELPLLNQLRIPRLVLDSTNNEVSDLIEINIFCDASKLAYGAAAYVKVRKQNEVLVNLITSKTRVAPLKAVTLPQLELLEALVAPRLSSRVWKQFVANRVQEISKLTDPDSWFHCSGQENPSDFLSKGLSVDTLISNNKWWNGPAFLRTDVLPETVSECPELNEVDYLPEIKSNDSKKYIVLTLNFN
ncbi:integrase catalytic domain-containing protein [Trichonephila clavipes]|nr:integrase catalytic domain-containing protein [Trichonephila clavipes]